MLKKKDKEELSNVDAFQWDEAPMSQKYAFEWADEGLRKLLKEKDRNDPKASVPFGGRIAVFGGDFRQCLPVKERAIRSELIDLSIKRSDLWRHFKVFKLTKNMRADPEEKEFSDYILKVIFILFFKLIFRWVTANSL